MATRDTLRPKAVSITLAAALLLCAACGGKTQEQRTNAAPTRTEEGAPASQQSGTASLAPIPAHAPAMSGQGALPGQESMPGGSIGGGSDALTWTVPKEWSLEPPKSAMRKAQYRLRAAPGDREDGECVVYYFGAGQGGDVKSNLDRWAAQFTGFGSNRPKFSETKVGGLSISRAEVRGTYTPSPMMLGGGPEPQPKPDYMLLGAIVPGPEANWFFKCTGPGKTMEANRAPFDSLLASVRPAR
jgi:hypothetical protein